MRPPTSAIGGLAAIVIVLIVALTYLVSVDKAGAPQVAVFGSSVTLIVGALVTLIARNQADQAQQQATQTPTITVNTAQPLDKEDVEKMVRAALEAAKTPQPGEQP